ncbi:MAG: hypothetical protein M2R45_01862 [Verrucomicrobia subdivision 3 bacterium]|nr:hypothetical protein [Limisphaerales bacterium]
MTQMPFFPRAKVPVAPLDGRIGDVADDLFAREVVSFFVQLKLHESGGRQYWDVRRLSVGRVSDR